MRPRHLAPSEGSKMLDFFFLAFQNLRAGLFRQGGDVTDLLRLYGLARD